MKKSQIYSLVLLLIFGGMYFFTSKSHKLKKITLEGETQGTTYNIRYLAKENENYQKEIDSILVSFSQSLSTYIPDSEISKFNRGSILKFSLPYFYPVLKTSKKIYEETNGAFDPTIMPLVRAWGFMKDPTVIPNQAKVDSIKKLVNFDSIFFDSVSICKLMPGMELDFNAIAQGYSVDVVADFLKSKGIENMMVEIGGEVYCKGKNERDQIWRVGIDKPDENEFVRELQAVIKVENRALATSGNYRKFYVKDGKKYSHTIDPKSGYPVEHNLLSASVFAEDCATADGYATAFLVIGLDKTIELLNKNTGLDAYLIYADESGNLKTFMTEGIKNNVEEEKGKN